MANAISDHDIYIGASVLGGVAALFAISYYLNQSTATAGTSNTAGAITNSTTGGSSHTDNGVTTGGDNFGTNSIDQMGNAQKNLPANPWQTGLDGNHSNTPSRTPALGSLILNKIGLNAAGMPTIIEFFGSGCSDNAPISIYCKNGSYTSVINSYIHNNNNGPTGAATYTTTTDANGNFVFRCSLTYMINNFVGNNYNPIQAGQTYEFYVVDNVTGNASATESATLNLASS